MPSVDLLWPAKGVTEVTPHGQIPPGFTPAALNVRPFDVQDGRLRGGKRPGTEPFLPSAINGSNAIQRIVQGTVAAAPAAAGGGNLAEVLNEPFPYSDGQLSVLSSNWTGYLDLAGAFRPLDELGTGPNVASNRAVPRTNNSDTYSAAYTGPSLNLGDAYTVQADVVLARNQNDNGLSAVYLIFEADTAGPVSGGYHHVKFLVRGNSSVEIQAIRIFNSGANLSVLLNQVLTLSDYFTGPNLLSNTVPLKVTVESGQFTISTGVDTFGPFTITNPDSYKGVGFGLQHNFAAPEGDDPTLDNFVVSAAGPSSLSGRSTHLVVVSGGNIYRTDSPPTTPTLATDGSGALDASTVFMGATEGPPSPSDGTPENRQRHIYFCDGSSYKRLNLETNTVSDWTAEVGTLPVDADNNVARIVALYRNRIVLAGLLLDPQNWFMSALGDPLNYDYSPSTTTATQAVAGNNSDAGLIGDIITALAPYSDDTLIVGGDRTIWRMTGDPAEGGRIDNVSYDIGIAGADAITRDPFGNLYLFATNGFNRLNPRAGVPELVSGGKLDRTFSSIDLSTTRVILAWNRDRQGCHIFFSPAEQGTEAPRHFWYDQRTDSLWPEQYPISNGPTAAAVFDGDDPNDRALLLGGWDSFVRRASLERVNDHDTSGDAAIESFIDFGPSRAAAFGRRIQLSALQFVLGRESGDVALSAYAARTAEQAIDATTPRFTRTLTGGLNRWVRQRVADHAIRLRLSQNALDVGWSFEQGIAELSEAGRLRGGR